MCSLCWRQEPNNELCTEKGQVIDQSEKHMSPEVSNASVWATNFAGQYRTKKKTSDVFTGGDLGLNSNQVTTANKVAWTRLSETEKTFFRETQLWVIKSQEKEGLSALASVPAIVPQTHVELLLN